MPAKRAASAEEVAKTIVWLAAFGSTYLTGQSVAIDGGYTAQ
ncbi:SDR family oxidoreductase [Limnobacter sp.]